MINWGTVPLNSVLPFVFDTFAGSTGAPITLTGLATTDIEVYKGTSMTQRASDNGYALMDTDGIDIDTRTGIHGFSIDTSDNSDAGFYAAGSFYWVIVDAVTIDAQTVRFIAGTFRLSAAESSAGTPKADVSHFGGSAGTFSSGRPEVNTSHIGGSAISQAAGVANVNVTQLSGDATAADNAEAFFDGTGYAGTNNVIPTVTNLTNAPTNGDLTATMKASVNAEVDAALNTAIPVSPTANSINERIATLDDNYTAARAPNLDNLDAAVSTRATPAQVNTEVDTALVDIHLDHLLAVDYDPAAKPGALTALLNELIESDAGVSRFTANALEQAPTGGSAPTAAQIADAVWDEAQADHVAVGSFGEVATEVAAILVDTGTTLDGKIDTVDTVVDAIKAKTDSLTFTVANQVDANIQSVNDVTVTGNGQAGSEWGP